MIQSPVLERKEPVGSTKETGSPHVDLYLSSYQESKLASSEEMVMAPKASEKIYHVRQSNPPPNGTTQETILAQRSAEEYSNDGLTFLDLSYSPLDEEVIRRPSDYVASLPSKGVRSHLLAALNVWYQVPEPSLRIIETVITLLHNSSLMLDDMQDNSPLRRGRPTAHMVFGPGQTMNSAYFMCVEALRHLQTLNRETTFIYIDELRTLHIGQSHDLNWSYASVIPSEEEYVKMCDAKTSGLFRMISRLMRAEATNNRQLEIEDFMTLLGRFFQIRDDYLNLVSDEYTSQKGFCEDLDEGKYSLPLIHALRAGTPIIESLLQQRKKSGNMRLEMKVLVTDKLKELGSLDYSLCVIRRLQGTLKEKLNGLESTTGEDNNGIRLMIEKLCL